MMKRRDFLRVSAGGLIAAPFISTRAWAAYPDKQIHWIVPYPPGGTTDILARLVAQFLSDRLGQQFVIENRAGGGNNIGTDAVVRAAPDGYTVLLVNPANGINTSLYKKLPFNFVTDIAPMAGITRVPNVMEVNPNVPAKTVAEFITYAKANPGKINMASSGIGTSVHLSGELFMAMTGVKMTHVPFRGNGPSSAALLGGQIDLIIDGLAPQLGNIAEHRVRVLGVTTKERTPFLPDAPAVSETLPGYQFPMWVGLFAPAKTPRDIVARMSAEIAKAVRDPATKQRYTEVKVDAVGSTPEEFDKFFREQLKFNEDIIKSANIQQQD